MTTATARKTTAPATRKAGAKGKPATTAQISAWTKELSAAVVAEKSAATQVLDAVIKGRALKLPEDKAREQCKAAFASLDKRVAAKRVADAMAILKAPDGAIPAADKAPGNLQRYADAVRASDAYRKAFPSNKRAPSTGSGGTSNANVKKANTAPQVDAGDAPSKGVEPVTVADVKASLSGTIEGLRKRAADKETLSLLAELADLLA